MAAQADIVLADGQASPANHTFSKRGADMKVALWRDISGGLNVGMPTISMSLKETNGSDGKVVVDIRISLPVLETISGSDGGYTPSPKVAYTEWFVCSFTLPNRATLQNRKDILAYAKNLLANAAVTSLVQDLDRPT